MKSHLTIGEMGSLFRVPVQTLHYYDSIGLFVPHGRTASGHRLYRFDQIYQLASIRYLKKLGYSLKQIKEHMDSRTVDYSLEEVKDQSDEILRQVKELTAVRQVILRKIQFTEKQIVDFPKDPGEIILKIFQDRFYLPIGEEELLYGSDHFYFFPTIVFYRGKKKDFGALLSDTRAIEKKDLNLKKIEGGDYLCEYHQGPYEQIRKTIYRIQGYAQNHYFQISPDSLHINIIDQFIESDSEEFITEVQFRVLS